jgi:hypothetical protein
MVEFFWSDESGAVTIDWVTLTAGILILGIVVVFAVMNNSAGYLMDEFEDLNEQYEENAVSISALDAEIDLNQ